MTPWQILQAARAASAARDFYSQRGGGVSASAVAAAVGRCSSFHMSRGKLAMQELNGRLAWYLQQVGRPSSTFISSLFLELCRLSSSKAQRLPLHFKP